jgi:hypothetical protein
MQFLIVSFPVSFGSESLTTHLARVLRMHRPIMILQLLLIIKLRTTDLTFMILSHGISPFNYEDNYADT